LLHAHVSWLASGRDFSAAIHAPESGEISQFNNNLPTKNKTKTTDYLEQYFIILPYTIKLIFYQLRLPTQLAENHRTDQIPKNKYINTHTTTPQILLLIIGSTLISGVIIESCVTLVSLQKKMWLLKLFDQNSVVLIILKNCDFKSHLIF
jgi:hypothetical protein